tara:strand:- start:567 stop:887 length:321 start_codon:yes stop_codon:yes gene_type:complete
MNIKINNPVIADLVKDIEINQDNMMKLNLLIQMFDSPNSDEMSSPQIGRKMGIPDASVRKLEQRAKAKLNTEYEAMLKEEQRLLDKHTKGDQDPSINSGEQKIWQN